MPDKSEKKNAFSTVDENKNSLMLRPLRNKDLNQIT